MPWTGIGDPRHELQVTPGSTAFPARPGALAVIDIGSNSIRLVVYDSQHRAAVTLFNEKVLCGLGRGLAKTGRLNPKGAALARDNLVRFTRLARAMGVGRIDLLATAAVRDAADGPEFKSELEALSGHEVQVLSGQEEGRLSALGVAAGFPGAQGIMGDLGGGSLELVELIEGRPGRSVTLPLGPLKLMDTCAGNDSAIAAEVGRCLASVEWLDDVRKSGDFFAVGGAWRNLARINMEKSGYPLRVVQDYVMGPKEVGELAAAMGQENRPFLARVSGLTKARLEVLPTSSIVLSRVMDTLGSSAARFSAFGLREGHVFDLLTPEEQARDPLLTTCADIAGRDTRLDRMADPLMAWTDPLFTQETPGVRRLRQASCSLSDIAWREYPDYRAKEALFRILYFPFIGLNHVGRVFLGLAAYTRYGGREDSAVFSSYRSLLSPEEARVARVLGLAQRLAYQLSGATREVLAQCALRLDDANRLHLVLPKDGTIPAGDAVQRRLAALAEALEAEAYVIGG